MQDWWHYTPAWYRPHIVVIAGLAFIVGCNLGTEPSLHTTFVAATPVAFGWFIFLYLIPSQFKQFAKTWINEHPECEEHARQQQEQEQAQAQAQKH